MSIHNQIFEEYRINKKEINKAIELLRRNNYIVHKVKEYERK